MRLNKDFMLAGLFSCCLGVVCFIDHLTNSSMQRPQKSRRVLSTGSTTPFWRGRKQKGRVTNPQTSNEVLLQKEERKDEVLKRSSASCVNGNTFLHIYLNKNHHYYHNSLQYGHCILALKLLVVCEPVNQLHDQRFKELPGNLMKNVRLIKLIINTTINQKLLWNYKNCYKYTVCNRKDKTFKQYIA